MNINPVSSFSFDRCCSTNSTPKKKLPLTHSPTSIPNGTNGGCATVTSTGKEIGVVATATARDQEEEAFNPGASSSARSKLRCCLPPARTMASALMELKLRKSREEMEAEIEAAKILDRQDGIKKQKNDPYKYR